MARPVSEGVKRRRLRVLATERTDRVTICCDDEQIRRRRTSGVTRMTRSKWLLRQNRYRPTGPHRQHDVGVRRNYAELRRRNRLLEQENEVLRRAAAYLSQSHLPGKGFTRLVQSSPPTASPSR